jgi:hypothetical protein
VQQPKNISRLLCIVSVWLRRGVSTGCSTGTQDAAECSWQFILIIKGSRTKIWKERLMEGVGVAGELRTSPSGRMCPCILHPSSLRRQWLATGFAWSRSVDWQTRCAHFRTEPSSRGNPYICAPDIPIDRFRYRLNDRGSISDTAGFLSSPQRPDRLWGPSSLLCNRYRCSFLGNKAAEAWSLPLTSIYCRG